MLLRHLYLIFWWLPISSIDDIAAEARLSRVSAIDVSFIITLGENFCHVRRQSISASRASASIMIVFTWQNFLLVPLFIIGISHHSLAAIACYLIKLPSGRRRSEPPNYSLHWDRCLPLRIRPLLAGEFTAPLLARWLGYEPAHIYRDTY